MTSLITSTVNWGSLDDKDEGLEGLRIDTMIIRKLVNNYCERCLMALLLFLVSLVNSLIDLIGSAKLPMVIGSLLLGCETSPVCPSTGLSERLLRPASSSTAAARPFAPPLETRKLLGK